MLCVHGITNGGMSTLSMICTIPLSALEFARSTCPPLIAMLARTPGVTVSMARKRTSYGSSGQSLAVVPVSDGNRKMCSLCHRSLPFWFSHESVGGRTLREPERGTRSLPTSLSEACYLVNSVQGRSAQLT